MVALNFPKDAAERNKDVAARASRLASMGMNLPDSIVSDGRNWYKNVNRAVSEQSREAGVTPSQGAGIVSAVSPNLDFGKNVNAIKQLTTLDESDWDLVRRSSGRKSNTGQAMPRMPEVTEMLRDKAPDLVSTYDIGLVKAHRIMQGEQWRNVLRSSSAPKDFRPKTYNFADNIENPEEETGVTIDYRHHDLVLNKMLPPKLERGLTSSSRYNTIEGLTKKAAESAGRRDPRFEGILPHDFQAVVWMGGKWVETSGGSRKVGKPRRGQPYTTARGAPLQRDSAFWKS